MIDTQLETIEAMPCSPCERLANSLHLCGISITVVCMSSLATMTAVAERAESKLGGKLRDRRNCIN